MTTHVRFQTAKLLKEKGFDKYTNGKYYNRVGTLSWCEEFSPISEDCKDKNSEVFYAPTIAEVVMWILKKDGIWIYAECDSYGTEWYAKFSVASKQLWENKNKRHLVTGAYRNFLFIQDSVDKAYEAAIEYCLTKLI